MAIIATQGLSQKYGGRYTLRNVNLSIESGEVFIVIGPTGSGKTTLLRLVNLLDTPASGKINFDGVDVTQSKKHRFEARRRMSFVQQKPVVFNMSVFENIACGLRWRGEKDDSVRPKVDAVLRMVDMAEYEHRNARTLSGGETQRVAIARALVTDPELLLLDEPTANLDPVSTVKIEEVLGHIIRQHQTTVMMATHDMLQGQRLASRIGVITAGELRQVGNPGDIFASPDSKEVAEFVGVENILAGTITDKENSLVTVAIDETGQTIQALSDCAQGETVYAMVRPEDVILTIEKSTSSARNTFAGKVTRMTQSGPLVKVEIDCGFWLRALITGRSANELNIVPGLTVHASFKATAVRTIKRWN